MSATCPTCGKPVRIGAKFCGSCGGEMPGTTPLSQVNMPAPAPEKPASPEQPNTDNSAAAVNGLPCPHCNKTIKSDAKFCNFCGKSVFTTAVSASPQHADNSPVEVIPAPLIPPVIPPVPPPPARLPSKKKRSKKGLVAFLVIVVLILCAVALIFVLTLTGVIDKDKISSQFAEIIGRFGKATPTVEVTEAPTETPEPTDTPEPTLTPEPTAEPTTMPTLEPTAEPEDVFIFQDDFASGSDDWWTVWGVYAPESDSAEGTRQLTNAVTGESGIVSTLSYTIMPGTELIFIASLNGVAPNDIFEIDWDTSLPPVVMGTKDGSIHVSLSKTKQELTINNSSDDTQLAACSALKSIDDAFYTYTIEIKPDKVVLSMEGGEICSVGVLPPDLDTAGRLSLSGNVLLDKVTIR